ncbi:hypothetical protein LTR56_008299 [Elasticomyces elasticus]|nr:hypothetical protein LTR56_008299 [Elasticomyces elasticus]KAK3661436.1 hypothetical protein LTR22_007445 [Elasticomyces elasticus]KAK4926207.1 hypothetical protein LTR49_006912 [Elasticomyces elasticus]KAK4960395.1 hypothetical protein LTR10_003290 [Elasticomyces elasticus]KAK4969561.1 hypothetical protein LTR42_008832 [Elasticomyces elasticus]
MSTSTRGRAGKYSKAKRGGGRNFSKNLRPLDADGGERSMWAEPTAEDSSDEDEDSEEESSDDDGAPAQAGGAAEVTREERKAATKAKKEAAIKKKQGTVQAGDMPSSDSDEDEDDDSDDMPVNPNLSAAARKQVVPKTVGEEPAAKKLVKKDADLSQLSRREREALEAQQKKERYQKLHAEGKTEEARADMERLKLVRQQREEAAAQKDAEKQEKDSLSKEKKEQMARLDRAQALKAARGARGSKKGGKA